MWPPERSGPSIAHYLLLALIHRICQPGPKTEVADWYRSTILHSLWGFSPERFRSQDFWDAFGSDRNGGDVAVPMSWNGPSYSCWPCGKRNSW